MSAFETRMAVDARAGSVILPLMLETPLEAVDLVGRTIARTLDRGARITVSDLQEQKGPDFVPFYEYLERPGAIDRIVDLDRRAFDEMGDDFSDRPWDADSFRLEIPGKADVSFVAEFGEEFVGYYVGSGRVPAEIHGHRMVLERKWRTGRIAFQLWCAHWRGAVANPNTVLMTAETAAANRPMRRFLEAVGFRPLSAEGTREYLERRGRNEPLDGTEIIDEGGARSIALAQRLRESD